MAIGGDDVRARAIIGAATCLLVAPALAQAAGWVKVTANGPSIDQVGLLRTADGKLHAAWHQHTSPLTEDLLDTTLSPGGKLLGTAPIQSGWADIQNPALVQGPEGIRVFWGGIRTTATDEPNQELNTAFSGDGGASWSLLTGSVVPIGAQAYGSPVAAATLPDGTPLEAWAGTLGTWVHAGLVPDAPNHDFQAPLGNYGYDTGLATDAAGRAVLAWYSNAAGHLGVYAQDVAADGSPVGAAVNFPGTANMQVGQIGRTPIVARPGGGFYVAYATGYPAQKRIRLWKVGAAASTPIARTARGSYATVAADDNGRLWVAWVDDDGGDPHVLARRSNPSGRVFGEVVDAGRAGEGVPGVPPRRERDRRSPGHPRALLGGHHLGRRHLPHEGAARAHPEDLPPADPRRQDDLRDVHRARRRPAGEERPRRAAGESDTTNASGKVTLDLSPATRIVTARASSTGYVGADQGLVERTEDIKVIPPLAGGRNLRLSRPSPVRRPGARRRATRR